MGAQLPTLDEIEALMRRVVREELGARSGGPRREVVSKRTAARMLGVDRGTTLAAMIEDGQIRTVEIRGRVCIPREDVERVISTGAPAAQIPQKRRPVAAGGAAALAKLRLEDL